MTRITLPLAFVAACALASSAQAQTTTTTSPIASIAHYDGNSSTSAVNSVWYINKGDCNQALFAGSEPAYIRVNVGTIIAAASLPQIWIGTSCLTATNRSGSTSATCAQAVGGTAAGFQVLNSVATIPITALMRNQVLTTNEAYNICPASGNITLSFFMFPASASGDIPSTTAIEFKLTADLSAPGTPTVSTSAPSGDRTAKLDWSANPDLEAYSQTYYYAVPGGCGSIGMTDGGVGADGGVGVGFAAGSLPPVNDASIKTGTAGTNGHAEISTSALGLADYGDSAAVGLTVRDIAGNYGVLSNIVCVTKVQTFGLCGSAASGSANCPRGCSMTPSGAPARSHIVLVGIALMAIIRRRRGART